MKQFFTLLCIAGIIFSCSVERPSNKCTTFSESPDPSPDTLADWNGVKTGLQATLGSIDQRYDKSSVPGLSLNHEWQGSAWRGERVSAQLVLWSKDSVEQITCGFSEFTSPDGNTLPAEIARAHFVRYVVTDIFANGCGPRKPEDYPASLSPDMLDTLSCFHMEAGSTRPVWITFDIPDDATPGIYTANMQLNVKGKKKGLFTFAIDVLPQTLPPASEWKFHLDLWQNPYAVARVHNAEPWSEQHWEALYPLMKMLAGAGQKVITATLNNRPWGGQTEDPFGAMIQWTKKQDGSWKYDYTVFDQWVEFMMDLGIKSQINCYSMVPWGNELYYFDEQSNKEEKIKAKPGTETYKTLWTPFLEDFSAHLQQKGWYEITRIAMDERKPAEMQAMLKLLQETAPGLGVALADNHKSYKLYPDMLKDLCVIHGSVVDTEDLEYRRSKGYVTTWYVCCANPFPNVFTFSPPAEAAFIGWYTTGAGFDGFLRWAYNSWVQDPLTDSRFRTWPAGDTYIVYPDARSSIRFERLREGIQDAEKIRILREKLESEGTTASGEKLRMLNETVALFNRTTQPEDPGKLLARGKKILKELSVQ